MDKTKEDTLIYELLKRAYTEGYKDGITLFARWEGGIQVVGVLDTSKKRIFEELEKQYNYCPPEYP